MNGGDGGPASPTGNFGDSEMSDFRLQVVIPNDYEEPAAESNTVDKILNGIKQESILISNFATNAGRRAVSDRFFKGNQASHIDSVIDPFEVDEMHEHRSERKSGPLLSGTAYCISSCSMILLNKVVLSTYNFNAGISLMLYQNLICCLVVAVLSLTGAVSVEKLNWKLIRVWVPVNAIFVGMLVSGMYSLKNINIAMVTIMKNVTNILTAIGELYIFRKHQNQKVWAAMFLMIISAVSGGITDLTFDAMGYTWQIMNCILTASYSISTIFSLEYGPIALGAVLILQFPTNMQFLSQLTLRRVMDKAKQSTRCGSLNEISMVLLNNLLCLPFAVFLILLFDEWKYVINVDVIKLPMFWIVATASGLLGLAISFTSMWFLRQTGPTTYSLVGSLNKIPISIAGLVLFEVPLSLPNLFSILFGLFAGIFFARAKMS